METIGKCNQKIPQRIMGASGRYAGKSGKEGVDSGSSSGEKGTEMTGREFKEYLWGFGENKEVFFLLANPKKRKLYKIARKGVITDSESPVIFIEVGEEKDMDEELVKACEEDEEEEDTGNAIPTNHYTERFQRVT